MKKLLLIFSLLFAVKSFAQYPLVQGLGNDSTLIRVGQNYKGGIKGGLINMTVADTTAANLLRIKAYPGAQIFTDDGNVWVRNITATGWVLMGGGGSSPSGSFWKIGGNLFPVTAPTRDIGTLAPYGGAVGFITNGITRLILPDAGLSYLSASTDSILVRDIDGNLGLIPKSGGGVVSAWELSGNSATNPATNWLGTNDSVAFRMKVVNRNAGYIMEGGFNSGGGINYSRQFTSFGMLAGNKIITDIIAGTSNGGLNMLLGPGAGMNIGNTYDTTAGSPSDQNLIITNVGAGPYIQQNSFVTGNGRNVLIGESTCHSCLTPGENTGVGMFVMENAYRPTKNAVFGSSALRAANDASYMTSIGAYASHLTGCSISGVTITNGGSGYTTATVTFSAPLNWGSPGSCYTTATGTATISGGAIVGIVITNPGCGYSTLTGTYPNGGRTEKPIITITGDGTGFAGTPVVSCGDNTTTVGHAAGWLMKAPKYQIYIGSGSEPTAAYFDQYGGAIGTGAGRHSSVSALTTLSNAWAIGTNAKVSTDRTLTIGAPSGDSTLKVVINNHTGDSTFSVYGGGLYVERGLRIGGFPQPNTAAKNYYSKVTSDGTVTNSRMIEITNGTGNYVSIDDAQTGATTTNNFLFNVANSFTGDGSGSQTPLIYFASRAASVLDLNILQLSAPSASDNSVIKYTLGRNMATRNMFYSAFNYISNGSTSNYFDESFYGVAGIRRSYASGNTTFGVAADNGYKVEIGGKARVTDSLHVGVVGTTTGTLNLGGATSGIVSIKPANAAGTYTLTLPTTDGASGEFLQTDGSGVLTWAAASGGGTPAGNFGNLQINRNGAFATPGSDSLDFESATGLSVKGNISTTTELNAPRIESTSSSLELDASGGGHTIDMVLNAGSTRVEMFDTWQFTWGYPGVLSPNLGLKRDADAVLKITNGTTGTGDLILRNSTFSGRNKEAQGADIASANNLSLGADGNAFEITGTTTINLISNTNWQNGSVIRLVFSSSLTVTNNAGTSGSNINILLAGGANFSATANDILTLMLCEIGSVQNWVEVSRSVN